MKLGFLHIPRTGGTFLESHLAQLGPNKFINFFGTPENQVKNRIGLIEQIENNIDKQNTLKNNPNWDSVKIFSGHFSLNIDRFINEEVNYFTILREPIQRTTSFIKKVTTSKKFNNILMQDVKTIGDSIFWSNFEGYITSKNKNGLLAHERHGFSNYMTKAIAGCNLANESLEVTEEVYLKAIENLDKMHYVGIFEKYETTIHTVLSFFNIEKIPTIHPLNISKIPEQTKKLLQELNQYDSKLYNYFINKNE